MNNEYDYEGHDINIQEMPQGCVISSNINGSSIVVSSLVDAEYLIESLWRMLKSMKEN